MLEALERRLAAVTEEKVLAGDQLAHDVGDEHLPAIRFRSDARSEDHGGAEEIVVLGDRF